MKLLSFEVNAFQVKSIESDYMQDDPYMQSMISNNLKTSRWVDTVIVPPRGKVVVWTRFQKGYFGKTVFHCHFLGMHPLISTKNCILSF